MSVPTVKLNDGTTSPVVGFGIGTAHFGKECSSLVLSALKTGYTYLDAAQGYANSESIGDALKQWGGDRDKLYILTKYSSHDKGSITEVLHSELKKLGVKSVDMYLIHSPIILGKQSLTDAWKEMESLHSSGLTKSIGVSNFREEDIEKISTTWTVPPAVNQIEYHAYISHAPNVERLKTICDQYDIKFQCYGPSAALFRTPGGPVDEVVKQIAQETGATDVQVTLKWAEQSSGGIVVTTSRQPDRQKEQLEAFTSMKPLTAAQVSAITEAGKKHTFRHFQNGVWNAAKP